MASSEFRCPCGHIHPGGAGASWCLCNDCFLWWSPTPRHLLAPAYRDRLDELVRMNEEVRRG